MLSWFGHYAPLSYERLEIFIFYCGWLFVLWYDAKLFLYYNKWIFFSSGFGMEAGHKKKRHKNN
jgi:hypothetical protein